MVDINQLYQEQREITVYTLGALAPNAGFRGVLANQNKEWIHLKREDGAEWLIPIAAIAAITITIT